MNTRHFGNPEIFGPKSRPADICRRLLPALFAIIFLNAFAGSYLSQVSVPDPGRSVSAVRPTGQIMMVLGKDGKSRKVDLPPGSRPQSLENVFASTDLQTGKYRGQQVRFFVKDGWAIIDGDIAIARASDLIGGNNAIAFAQYKRMWPKVGGVYQIPYIITFGNANIIPAINYINATFAGIIQLVPRAAETDYVNFQLTPGDFSGYGFSTVGRAPTAYQPQQLGGAENMSFQTLLHEIGHTIGLYHEQQRNDRNTYIEFHPENMSNQTRSNSYQLADYFQLDGDIQDVGLYDYASTMHYFWDNLAKKVGPVHESIPHGIQIARNPSNPATGDYSAGDIDGIKRLYDATPSQITVTSNPPGLQVIVDGATVTTPQTYSWTFGSVHSLSVAANGQTVGGKSYVYGRWNDNAAATHNITVTDGNGTRVSPRFKPAVTVYTANFINLIKYTTLAFPGGTGTISESPAPQNYPGFPNTDFFYVARQPVQLTGTPTGGNSFYGWFNIPLYSYGRNPQTFYWDSDTANIDVFGFFTSSPVYSFGTNILDKHLWVFVDGGFYYSPVIKSPDPTFDGAAWNAGTTHSVNTDASETPFYYNTRHQFQNWSDGGAILHNVTLPAASTNYTANFQTQYRALAESPCGGTPAITPFSGDGFYNTGTSVTVGQTPDAGYFFTGWREDLSGTVTPQTLPLNDELYAIANYNVNGTPFSMTSLSPSSVVQNSAGFTLTINGTGFTPTRTFAYVNDIFRAITFINANQITVPVLASDITTPGGISIFVQNFPVGAVCGVYNNRVLQVRLPGPTAAAVSISGHVTSAAGNGIGKASVTISTPNGSVRTSTTGSFGYFRFEDVEVGGTYVLTVAHKRYQFETPSRVITLSDEVTDADFVAMP